MPAQRETAIVTGAASGMGLGIQTQRVPPA